MAGTDSLWCYGKDLSNDRYGSLEKNSSIFSEIFESSNGTSCLNDKNKPLNFKNIYSGGGSKSTAISDGGKYLAGVLVHNSPEVKKLEEEAALATQQGTKKAVITKRKITNLFERKSDQLASKLIGEEDITKLFFEITARLYREKETYAPKSKETESYRVTNEDVLNLCEHLEAFKPSGDYRIDLTKQIINDGNLWMSNGRLDAVRGLVRELTRPVPEDQLEEMVKKPLKKDILKALKEDKLKEASNYLSLLFGTTLAIRTYHEPALNEVLLPSVDKLSKKKKLYEPLALAVASFLAGAPKPLLTEVRDKFKKLNSVWNLRAEMWVIREALR
ncbi:MAG: hypothetical protein AABW53_00825 [Nanoarchaeota archaeon]